MKKHSLKHIYIILFISIAAAASLSGCSGAESGPISIPVPFSGALTDPGTLAIAEGNPVGGGTALRLQGTKNQSIDNAARTWLVFDPTTGVERGAVTFFPDTLSVEKVEPLLSGGTRRVITLKAAAVIDGVLAISPSFECYDFSTDYPVTFSAQDCSGNPDGIPVVRKMTCSGVDDFTGLLFDGKFMMGMIQNPAMIGTPDEFQFCTQQESYVFVHGSPFTPLEGESAGKVTFTMLLAGGGQPVPDDPAGMSIDLLLPGSDEIQGQVTLHTINHQAVPPDSIDLFDVLTNEEFQFNDGSRLVTRNCRTVLNRVPELADVIRGVVETRFPDFAEQFPELVERGEVYFNTIEKSECDPIDCSEGSPDVDGIFRDLCDQFGSLRSNFLCFILSDPESDSAFPTAFDDSVWVISRE